MDRLSSKTAKIRCVLMLGGFLVILMVLTRIGGLVLAVTIKLAFGRSDGGKISLMILGNRKLSLKTR